MCERTKLFISYSHKDVRYLERLYIHLADLERCGFITVWSDKEARLGIEWRKELEQAIASAKAAVILVSADFLASRFIAENELPPLLAAAKTRGLLILPTIISPCEYEYTELSQFLAVNKPSHPLTSMNHHQKEEVWKKIARSIRESIIPQNSSHRNGTGTQDVIPMSEEKPANEESTIVVSHSSFPLGYKRPDIPHFRLGQEIMGVVVAPPAELRSTKFSKNGAYLRYKSFPIKDILMIVNTNGRDRWHLGETHTCLFKSEEIYHTCTLLICQACPLDLDDVPQKYSNRLLAQERQRLGLTPEDIAKHFGIDAVTVYCWEDGTTVPSPYFIKKLSTFFGKSAQDLGFHTYNAGSEWRYSNTDAGEFADECGHE